MDFDEVITRYNQQAKGPNKAEIMTEFVKTMNSAIFSMEPDNSNSRNKEDEANERRKIE